MMRKYIFWFLTMLIVSVMPSVAQVEDSVDVTDYDIELDLSAGKPFAGKAVITMQLLRQVNCFDLQLYGTVDSLVVDGVTVAQPDLAQIPVGTVGVGVPFTVIVFYHGSGHVEGYGWGGFHFDSDMSYNLGVSFNENPHSIGRATFPCRDNFTDKATYTLRVKTRAGWTAECGGIKQSATIDSAGFEYSVWRIDVPTPVYLVSVSQANYHRINTTVAGYPLTLGFTTQDSVRVAQTFTQLDAVVPMFERCFGPYRWGRIGYIATKKGSMEHVNNIALAREFMDDPNSAHGRITIPHEFGHAWFGNLVTCRTEADMWFNEGGASFTSEVAREATDGREASIAFYQENLENVIRTAHITDGRYLPLSPMPHSLTYGSTTYDKGALVWHSLRGYLGDSVFYAAMQRLFTDKAYGTVDAYEVRDSLQSYTGVDLTGFFDFHVFTKGFVDYHIEMLDGMLNIEQQGVYTNDIMRSSRVPVTFIAADGSEAKRWYQFSGVDTVVDLSDLPFEPLYCLLDRDCEISDAATRGEMHLTENGQKSCDVAHFFVVSSALQQPTDVYVEHHWGKPYGLDTVAGIVRTSNRYWVVSGNVDYTSCISGRFRYSSTSNLDLGFYNNTASLDSMVLMHRYNSSMPWTCVSRYHTSPTNGYFGAALLQGEYALAIVEPGVMGADIAYGSNEAAMFPNPLKKGEALTIEVPTDEPFTVTIIDVTGHQVWQKNGCRSGRKIRPRLAKGTYLVVIENKCVSLQSKLIQL